MGRFDSIGNQLTVDSYKTASHAKWGRGVGCRGTSRRQYPNSGILTAIFNEKGIIPGWRLSGPTKVLLSLEEMVWDIPSPQVKIKPDTNTQN